MSHPPLLRIGAPLYGGAFATSDPAVSLPFVLPGELAGDLAGEPADLSPEGRPGPIAEPSPQRAAPLCPHFGVCGGCQYQHADYSAQLSIKREILTGILHAQAIAPLPAVETHASPQPYGYRNRIRLRIERVADMLRIGYNLRGTTSFLPITTCPISAPGLIGTAAALLALAAEDPDAAHWLDATRELELFANDDLSRIQLTLFVAPRTKSPQGSFARMTAALQQRVPQVAGAAAAAFDARTGPTGRILAEHGAAGLNYKAGDETYWVSRGGFFQINRFLIATLVDLVTAKRSGALAWDLFAGVGLFSRVLARGFLQVTAVEAASSASQDLAAVLKKLGPRHRAVTETTLAFLQKAVVQRERPDLIVLDPPRAGAGVEACDLLLRLAPREIIYVSCDPTTLARDLAVLQKAYTVAELHLVDLFPQTFHLETVVVLKRQV